MRHVIAPPVVEYLARHHPPLELVLESIRAEGLAAGLPLVDAATAAVTATEIRTRAASQMSLEGLVPESVASYINGHELYQGVA